MYSWYQFLNEINPLPLPIKAIDTLFVFNLTILCWLGQAIQSYHHAMQNYSVMLCRSYILFFYYLAGNPQTSTSIYFCTHFWKLSTLIIKQPSSSMPYHFVSSSLIGYLKSDLWFENTECCHNLVISFSETNFTNPKVTEREGSNQ